MSTDLENNLRTSLGDVPGPEGADVRVRRAVLAALGPSRSRRHWLPTFRRGLGWVATAAAASGVALVLALLVVATPSEGPTGQGEETGVEYVLRALPNRQAVTPDAAADALAEIVRSRAQALGVADVSVEADGDRVTVFVPRTHDTSWIRLVIGELNLSVYDAGSAVASGPTVDEVVAAATSGVPDGEPRAWYVVAPARPAPDAMPGYLEGPIGTEAEATERARELATQGWPGIRPESVPAGVAVASDSTERFLALTDPLVRPGDIAGVRADGATITLQVAAHARADVAQRLEGVALAQVTVVQGAATWFGTRLVRYEPATGDLVFRALTSRIATNDAARSIGLDALVAVEEARPIGPAPDRRGRLVDTVPANVNPPTTSQPTAPPAPGSIRLALTTSYSNEAYGVYTWLSQRGEEIVGVTDPRGGYSTPCAILPQSRFVQPCVGGRSADGQAYKMVGRVTDQVDALRVVYADGTSLRPAVVNGVVLFFLPRDRPPPVQIEVLDVSGAVIGTVDPREPDVLPFYGG